MEGLEISIQRFSEIRLGDRSDAEYYSKENIAIEHALIDHHARPISRFSTVIASAFYPAATDLYGSGDIPFARCVDCVPYPVISHLQDALFERIPRWFMEESGQVQRVKRGDIIVTKVGTPCFASVVHDYDEIALSRTVLGLTNIRDIDPYYLVAFLRSRYGFSQLMRQRELTIQYQLTLERIRDILIFEPSTSFQIEVAKVIRSHVHALNDVHHATQVAENTLLTTLNLENWQPPNPLSYTRSSADTFAAGRFDAEHFKPKFAELITHIENTGNAARLGSLLAINDRGNQPEYAEIGLPVVNSKHIANNDVRLDADNRVGVASAAKVLIEPGDVLLNGTGVGTIGRSAPYLHAGKAIPDNHVTILRPKKAAVDPVYLSVFINSLAGQLQVEQRMHGSSGQIELYPTDIADFTIWLAPEAIQQEIRQAVESGFAAKQKASQLLEAAKRAVEIAIEDTEAAALNYLDKILQETGDR